MLVTSSSSLCFIFHVVNEQAIPSRPDASQISLEKLQEGAQLFKNDKPFCSWMEIDIILYSHYIIEAFNTLLFYGKYSSN